MNKSKESIPSSKQIAEYWKGKFISKKFEIINYYEDGAKSVITDCGEPECWACGMFNAKIYDNPKYYELLNTNNFMRVWNFSEFKYLQKAHILSKMLGGKSEPSNYFLLCKKCHQESPDYSDTHFFYAYIYQTKGNAVKVTDRRNKEMIRAIYELAFLMKKNIFTIDRGVKNIRLSAKKMGLHITNFSLYTEAAVIVDGMDDLIIQGLSDKDLIEMRKEYLKFDIIFTQ